MKNFLILFLALGLLFSLDSCKKDKNEGDPGKVDEQTGEPDKFSSLKPEDHKSNIADVGVDFINELDELSKSDAAEAAINFTTLMEGDNSEENYKSAVAFSTLTVLSDFAQERASIFDVLRNLRTLTSAVENDPTIEEQYQEDFAGTWEWDSDIEDFEQTAEGNLAIFKFPATASSTTNNAVFTVEEFSWDPIAGDLTDGELTEVPVKLSANLKVDGNTAMEVIFTGKYNAKGVPESIDASMKIGTYELYATLSNDFKDASAESGMKHGDKQVIKFSVGINGDFTDANIEDNTHTVTSEPYCINWDWETGACIEEDYDEWTEVDIEKILEGSYGFIDVLNIRIGGEVNVKDMVPAMDNIDWDIKAEEEANTQTQVDAMNEYMNFYVAYVDKSEKIAEVEFFVTRSDEKDEWCDWNEATNEVTCDDYYDYWADGRFIFGDDSKVDAETYFKDGFKSFFDELNVFIKEMNTVYSDYDMEIDEVDYEGMFDK